MNRNKNEMKDKKDDRNVRNRRKSGKSQVSYKNDYDQQRDDQIAERQDYKKSAKKNDPKWYAVDERILKDAASIPFSWAAGTTTNMTGTADYANILNVPGIQVLALSPSVGRTQLASDPLNIAAFSVYSWVRHANSGSANYDAPDLMLYLLSMSQVYSCIVWLERIYAEAYLYSQRNRYLPQGLLIAEGVDPVNVASNLADFRYGINIIISKAASFSVPNDMTIFNRHAFLYQNIYTEGSSIKDQLYMYAPANFWQYVITDQGGSLQLTDTNVINTMNGTGNLWTVTQLLEYANKLLAPIMSSEDMNIMSGDILKAYGSDKTIKLAMLEEVREILPIFDIGVLEQMKNAVVSGVVSSSLNVTQDPTTNILRSAPLVQRAVVNATDTESDPNYNSIQCYLNDLVLTTTTEDTDPGLVMESTRLMAIAASAVVGKSSNGSSWEIPIYTGTEVAVAVCYYRQGSLGTATPATSAIYSYDVFNFNGSSITSVLTTIERYTIFENFDFHPRFRHVLRWGTSPNYTWTMPSTPQFDVDNYAILDREDLRRLHETALLSEFHVPTVNRV